MEPIYRKTTPTFDITVHLTEDSVEKKTTWDIYLHRKGQPPLLLDHYRMDEYYTQEDQENYVGDVKKYFLIGDVIGYGNTIFMMVRKFDEICLLEYHLPEQGKVTKKDYFVQQTEIEAHIAYVNPTFSASIKIVTQKELYITWNYYSLLRTDLLTGKAFYIDFSDNYANISGILPDNPDADSISVSKELYRVLENQKLVKDKNKFKYISFLDGLETVWDMKERGGGKREEGITHFFYQHLPSLSTKIIRYDNYKKVWRIGDYKEIELKSEVMAEDQLYHNVLFYPDM